jgi:adenosylcobyric acid synthase
MSNFTDVDALGAEPGVRVRFTRSIADVQRADLVVVPGTKATVEDLARLRHTGLDRALTERARAGAPILGICGGYQLLGERIVDDVESGEGVVRGLGLLPVTTTFEHEKLLRARAGHCAWLDTNVGGYEIRHGRVAPTLCTDVHDVNGQRRHDHRGPHDTENEQARIGGELFVDDDGERDGWRAGSVLGTSWHGVLEHDAFRRRLLEHVAGLRGRRFVAGTGSFAATREAHLDVLGALVADHLHTERLTALIEGGVPGDLPSIATEVRPCCVS